MADNVLPEAKAVELLESGTLDRWLSIRLVQIAGGDSATAAIRAIEMLRQAGSGELDDGLAGISTDVILMALDRVKARLEEMQRGG